MSNKLIIAAAGSGKTKTIIDEALKIEDKNVLITTYTEANELGIKNKIINKTGGYIPQNIKVQAWYSFLLQHGVRPYQDLMNDGLWNKKIGFYLNSGSSSVFRGSNNRIYSLSEKDQFFQYYFNSKNKLRMYSDKVSEFIVKCNKKAEGKIIGRLARVFPYVFIDEVQDLAGYDLEILELLLKSESNTLLVGDPRQATYSTHSSKKNKKFKGSEIIHFFASDKLKEYLEIDECSLTTNYRSNKNICNFSNKLFPNLITSNSGQSENTDHDGIFFINPNDVDLYLKKYPCIQLRWNSRKKVNVDFSVMTFGESKGLTFNRVLIYPTNPIKLWLQDAQYKLSPTSRCKLYVALTRAKYSVGIVSNMESVGEVKRFNVSTSL